MDKNEIKQRINIVDLIGETVTLKKEGPHLRGLCPLHNDQKTQSLVVYPETRRWKCFGACNKGGDIFQWMEELHHLDFKAARAALEAKCGGVKDGGRNHSKEVKETVYDLVDTAGQVVAQHVRRDFGDGTKKFTWRRDGKESLGDIHVEDLPLYGLKALIGAAPGTDAIITEGEKAADALNALVKKSFVALGTATGANVCPSQSAFEPLIGSRRVYLWPDNDAPGYAHMTKIAEKLKTLGIEPYLIRWPEAPPKGDAADFKGDVDALLSAAGPWSAVTAQPEMVTTNESIEQRIKLLSGNSISLRAENIRRERTGVHSRITISLDSDVLAWDVFNIERNEERQRLARSAVERLPDGIDNLCSLSTLKGYLDAFTASLWDDSVSQDMPKLVTPLATITRVEFLAEPYVMTGGGTILFAPPGAGKSYICLLLAVSIDAGISKLWPVTQGRVLFINLERSEESVTRRLAMVNKALGLPATRPLLILNRRGRALADIAEPVRRAIKKHAVKVVFLDSISRFGSGDLNENQTANRTIDTLSSISPTWLALGHSPRADEGHTYGSVHWDAGADLTVQLSSQTKDSGLGIGLKITKSNDTPKGQQQTYALTFDANGLTEARPARPHEFGELALSQKVSPTQEIIDYLLDVGQATATEIADALGRNRPNVSTLLNSSEEFVKTKKEGKNQFWGVRNKLL